MYKLPAIGGNDLVKFLESLGFMVTRTRGSHVRLKAEDGRVTTVALHRNQDIPKGTLRKIVREDLELSLEEFVKLYENYKGK